MLLHMSQKEKPYRLRVSLDEKEYLKFKQICSEMGKPMSKVILSEFTHYMRLAREEKLRRKQDLGAVDVIRL